MNGGAANPTFNVGRDRSALRKQVFLNIDPQDAQDEQDVRFLHRLQSIKRAILMPDEFHLLPTPELKQAAKDCPLLEGNSEAWIVCCSRRFFPLAKRIARLLHVSRGNVAVRMNRAINLLKRRIDARTQSLPPKASRQS